MSGTRVLKRFDVIFDAEGICTTKFRNDVRVHLRGPYAVSVDLPTDEGPIHGGEGTAPYPLAYFTGALTACVMTQLRAFARRLDVAVGRIVVNTHCHWTAEQQGEAPYKSSPLRFTMDIDLGNDAAESDRRRLVDAARKGCFVEQSLRPGLVQHRLKNGDRWIEI